jgi:hypothetical protein
LKSVTNKETLTAVLAQLINGPEKSPRKLSQQSGLSQIFIQCILKENQFHKIHLVQDLHGDDTDRQKVL